MKRLVACAVVLLAALNTQAQEVAVPAGATVRVVTERVPVRITGGAARRATVSTGGPPATIRVEGNVVTIVAPASAESVELIVPRAGAALDVRSSSAHVTIDDVASVVLRQSSASARITRVAGDVTLDKKSGNAELRQIEGSVRATTATANLDANGVAGDVTVVSINGNTTLSCVAGSVTVSDTNGVIELAATRGDVNVETTSGRATWRGEVLSARSYRMKTLSGVVAMEGLGALRDVSIALTTHAGRIESHVPLPSRQHSPAGRLRRLSGTFGAARARVELDAFEGAVELQWNERGDDDELCRTGAAAVRDGDDDGADGASRDGDAR